MYITLVIDTTNYTFQLYDETGVIIGPAKVYARTAYRVTFKDPDAYLVYAITNEGDVPPPIGGYPKDRTIISTV